MSQIKWSDTEEFVPPINSGIVIKVYDGDSITIATRLPFNSDILYRFPIRLNGIDTPELRGSDDAEKEMAIKARNRLSELILNQEVQLKNISYEKYGRILADIYFNNKYINEILIIERFAVPYHGKTKKKPDSWLDYYLKGEL